MKICFTGNRTADRSFPIATMPAVSAVPPEIWLTIFECAVKFVHGYIGLDALERGYARNATLAACA